MSEVYLECHQKIFGGCPGPSCDRQCAARTEREHKRREIISAVGRAQMDIIVGVTIAAMLFVSALGVAALARQGAENWKATITAQREP